MAQVWIERFDSKRHADFMSTTHIGGIKPVPRSNLRPLQVLCVEVCSFTFQFMSAEQLHEAIGYFSKKVHPTTRNQYNGLEHYWQEWFERLPPGLVSQSKRHRVLKALKAAETLAKRL